MLKSNRLALLSRLIPSTALTCLVLSLIVSSQPAQAVKESGWEITSLTPLETKICLGQTVAVYGTYAYVNDEGDPLAPLNGPDKIISQASLGRTSPQNLFPGTVADYFSFDYTAARVGEDQIVAKVINRQKEAASAAVPITVQAECAYRYQLFAELRARFYGEDHSQSGIYTLTSKGLLYPENRNDPTRLGGEFQVRMESSILQYDVPGCTLVGDGPGYASGTIEVIADISSGYLVNVRISPPKNFDWVYHVDVVCDGKPAPARAAFDISQFSQEDPWIEREFLPDGGTQAVKIPLFEGGAAGVRNAGNEASYHASLTLTREKGQ